MSLIRQVVLQDPNDDTRLAQLDNLFQIPVTIDVAHHEVHEGDSFKTWAVDESMGDNDTIIIAFKTAAGSKRIHMVWGFLTLVGGDLQIWEGATWTTNTGTLNPIINRKRKTSPDSSTLLEDKTATPTFTATDNVLLNPTGLGTGSATSIDRHYAWGQKSKLLAGGTRSLDEFILKVETQYAVVFTADGGSNKAELALDWYEHTDA